jgi:hypothetical protein
MIREIIKEILPPAMVASFIKKNKFGVLYAFIAIASYMWILKVGFYIAKDYEFNDLMFSTPVTVFIMLLSLACAIFLLIINDSKKFLEDFSPDQKPHYIFKFKKTLILTILITYGLLYYFWVKFQNYNMAGISLFIFSIIILSVILPIKNAMEFVSEKGNNIQYIPYIGIVMIALSMALITFNIVVLDHRLDSQQIKILFVLISLSLTTSLLVIFLCNKIKNSDHLIFKLFTSILSVGMIFCALAILTFSSFLLSQAT